AYLRSRPLIRTLRLYDDGVTELDLSASHLSDVFLSTPKLAQVTLANGTEQLQCNSCAPQSVRFPAPAPPLRLTYYSTKHVIQKLPQGLSELSTLRIVRTPGFEPAALGGCEVRALELNEVSKVPRFEELLDAKLSALPPTDCFDFEVSKAAARKPPAELRLSFHGIRKSVATILKRAWKGHPHLEIRGIKGDAWLEANIDNPFRNWIDTERKKGEAACKAYAAALRKITKLKAPKQAELKAILKGFVAAINRLDKKYGIDTLEREHTLDGFCLLLDKAGAAKHRETWLQSFDQWRDF
ncbi:MAG TPA: hypothetical protein PKD61_33975, partial [Polyangiaceae bacterium]|nr:hypothetical protein [Polyangiaceae bacterium]